MNIAIFGYSGFLGSHISEKLKKNNNIIEINARNINHNTALEDIFKYFDKKLINCQVIVNCCANLNPKNHNDIFINEKLSKIIQDYILKKGLKIHLLHLSTINVFINERKDKYTSSKINSEKSLNHKCTSIVRLPLITNYGPGKKGDTEIFYKYLEFKLLPFFPMIYPGNIYRPLEIEKICIFINNLIESNEAPKVYNLMGKEIKSLWDIFSDISLMKKKKIYKINTLFLKKIVPNLIKNKIFEVSSSIGQLFSIDQSKIKEEVTYL